MSRPTMARQGDLLFITIPAVQRPTGAPVPRDQGRVILARGETTGHAHAVVAPDAVLYTWSDRAAMGAAVRELLASVGLTTEIRDEEVIGLLHTPAGAEVVHEEHAPIVLPADRRHIVLRQREYTPAAIRTMAD